MNNMRRGFTMIELIFVIVIIGILAAVAIPKLAATSIEAKRAKVVAFVGTLNRTVGPTMWTTAVKDNNGSVATGTSDGSIGTLCANIATYIDVPDDVVTNFASDCKLTIDPALSKGSSLAAADNNFTDGNTVEAPHWHVEF